MIRACGLHERKGIRAADLGCGKGAVSVRLAKQFGFYVHGIDAIPEFILEADRWAEECGVEDLCRFEAGDIRLRVGELKDYDLIVLGAIGPVLGGLERTLETVRKCLKPSGRVVVDHGFVPAGGAFSSPDCPTRPEMLRQILAAGMEIEAERIADGDSVRKTDEEMFERIRARALELIGTHPEKRALFEGYVRAQEEENDVLENKIICVTLLLRKTD